MATGKRRLNNASALHRPPFVSAPSSATRIAAGSPRAAGYARRSCARQSDAVSTVLADVIDFHRREEKPMWWRMFDRAEATPEALRDDPGCIEGVEADRTPRA